MTQIQTGLQLYTLRNLMKDDFYGTLQKVAEAGYKAVEFAGYGGNSATDLKAKMDAFGLKTMGAHVPYQRFDDEFDTVVNELLTLEAEFAIVPWLAPEARPTTRENTLGLAQTFNRWGEACKAAGLRFGYHNHDFELLQVDGEKTVLDVLLEETDPAIVNLELDIYWAQYAGGDAVTMIEKYADRLPMIHAKDLQSQDSPRDAVIGEGIIDWPGVIAAARKAGTEWFIVEQDTPDEPLADVARGLKTLEKLLG